MKNNAYIINIRKEYKNIDQDSLFNISDLTLKLIEKIYKEEMVGNDKNSMYKQRL